MAAVRNLFLSLFLRRCFPAFSQQRERAKGRLCPAIAIHHDYLVVRQVCHDHSPPPPLSPGRAEVVSGSDGAQPTRRPRLAPSRLTARLSFDSGRSERLGRCGSSLTMTASVIHVLILSGRAGDVHRWGVDNLVY
ncbi:unnamed protein product [Arctogadus glacialis]